jgi:hypothetical protein
MCFHVPESNVVMEVGAASGIVNIQFGLIKPEVANGVAMEIEFELDFYGIEIAEIEIAPEQVCLPSLLIELGCSRRAPRRIDRLRCGCSSIHLRSWLEVRHQDTHPIEANRCLWP